MARILVLIALATGLVACGASPPPAAGAAAAKAESKAGAEQHSEADGHDHGAESEEGHEHEHEEGEPDFAKIDPARAPELGIQVAKAAAGPIDESVLLTGRLIIDPRRVALVRARFPGLVREITKEVGEPVRRGEALARVESNESLTVYSVPAPLDGVVLVRNTNVGDVAGSDPLFQVGDVRALQAELQAFTATRALLRVGAAARISIGEQQVDGRVVSVAPELEGRTQARRVRVALQVPADSAAVPGQFVSGRVASGAPRDATVAVPTEAVRRLEGRDVVFIPEETGYRARAVRTGRVGVDRLEILEGLDVGEDYVAAGTFLLKAEVGKNQAEHEH